MECPNCGKEVKNGNKFCSHSCSASFNNKQRVKKEYFCIKCNKLIGIGHADFGRKKYCDFCNPNVIDWSTVTLGELKEQRQYQTHSRIRDLARAKIKAIKRFEKCYNCGYDKHVEVCHIKAINSFDESTTIDIINNEKNLVGLCPNCHWEFDNNILEFNNKWLEDIL